MKYHLFVLSIFFILSIGSLQAQQIAGPFNIRFTAEGQVVDKYPSLVLEEEVTQIDTLYELDGKYATKKVKAWRPVDTDFKLQNIGLSDQLLKFDVRQDGARLVLSNEHLKTTLRPSGPNKTAKRLVMPVDKGVKLSKVGWRLGMMSVPLKVYLSDNSDNLPRFTNNIESDINLGINFGYSTETHLFREGEKPRLGNHHFVMGFLTFNRLRLDANNTDNDPEVNDNEILSLSFGLGYQFGFRRFGMSVLFGQDFPMSSLSDRWVFKNQPWFGLGIGYQLF